METHPYPVILFYKYVGIENPKAFVEAQRSLCATLGLKGRVLIASEGINGTLAGPRDAIGRYVASLQADARFADIEIKVTPGDERTFPKLVVKLRPEIVTLNGHAGLAPDRDNHLSPAEWKRMMEEDADAVVVDVRNRLNPLWENSRTRSSATSVISGSCPITSTAWNRSKTKRCSCIAPAASGVKKHPPFSEARDSSASFSSTAAS